LARESPLWKLTAASRLMRSRSNTKAGALFGPVTERIVHEDPSDVDADDGAVAMKGPDAVDVELTPEAAEETADRLADNAVMARGQRRLRGLLHKPDKRKR
jgi:hypothetical protein